MHVSRVSYACEMRNVRVKHVPRNVSAQFSMNFSILRFFRLARHASKSLVHAHCTWLPTRDDTRLRHRNLCYPVLIRKFTSYSICRPYCGPRVFFLGSRGTKTGPFYTVYSTAIPLVLYLHIDRDVLRVTTFVTVYMYCTWHTLKFMGQMAFIGIICCQAVRWLSVVERNVQPNYVPILQWSQRI